jgi:hypothetical protein
MNSSYILLNYGCIKSVRYRDGGNGRKIYPVSIVKLQIAIHLQLTLDNCANLVDF